MSSADRVCASELKASWSLVSAMTGSKAAAICLASSASIRAAKADRPSANELKAFSGILGVFHDVEEDGSGRTFLHPRSPFGAQHNRGALHQRGQGV